jgi:hypothetical protein
MKRACIGLTIILTGLLIFGCLLVGKQSSSQLPVSVRFPVEGASEQVSVWVNQDGVCYFFLPAYANLDEATIVLNGDVSATINGCTLWDGMSCEDFFVGVEYELRYKDWDSIVSIPIMFLRSENVATMHIDTASGNMDYIHSKKGNKETCTVRIYDSMGSCLYTGSSVEMKGRGNATWNEYDKKPYSLQFVEPVDLLQMSAAENWILLANSTDPTQLKNKMIYDFADSLGLGYSPDSQWVDLYLNGEYVGLYLLTERNEIHAERVAIDEEGWLVSSEFEDRLVRQNYSYVSTDEGIALRIHEPKIIASEQQNAIKIHWQSIENAIMAEDNIDPITGRELLDLIDLDSWVRKYLIEEVFANGDACAISQFYYTPDPDGPTYAGPVWDEDYTLSPRGEWRLSYPNLLAARLKEQRSIWYYKLYQKEEFYNYLVKVYRDDVKPLIQILMDETVLEYAEKLASATHMNQIRWNLAYGMKEELDRSMSYLADRMNFLDQLWINGTEMVSIQINSFGVYQGNILIPVGSSVGHELVNPPENKYLVFQGWCFADTGKPFDQERPIYEDVEIFAKWENSTNKKIGRVMKMLPLVVIAVLGVLLLYKDMYHNKRHGD